MRYASSRIGETGASSHLPIGNESRVRWAFNSNGLEFGRWEHGREVSDSH